MYPTFRPSLETLENREVFSAGPVEAFSTADMAVLASKNEFSIESLQLATEALRTNSFAGDGLGTLGILPYLEQDNLYKSSLTSDSPWGDLNQSQIIAILIGLKQAQSSEPLGVAVGDFNNDGRLDLASVTRDADFEKWADSLSALPTEDRQQIIAILIGLVQKSSTTAEPPVTDLVIDPFQPTEIKAEILASNEYFARLGSSDFTGDVIDPLSFDRGYLPPLA